MADDTVLTPAEVNDWVEPRTGVGKRLWDYPDVVADVLGGVTRDDILALEKAGYRKGWMDCYDSASDGMLHDRADCIKERDRAVEAERGRMLDKVDRWVTIGLLSESEASAARSLLLVMDDDDMTPEDRERLLERARELAHEHPEWMPGYYIDPDPIKAQHVHTYQWTTNRSWAMDDPIPPGTPCTSCGHPYSPSTD